MKSTILQILDLKSGYICPKLKMYTLLRPGYCLVPCMPLFDSLPAYMLGSVIYQCKSCEIYEAGCPHSGPCIQNELSSLFMHHYGRITDTSSQSMPSIPALMTLKPGSPNRSPGRGALMWPQMKARRDWGTPWVFPPKLNGNLIIFSLF